jgi:DNA-binding NarL/FixJ family response regulator
MTAIPAVCEERIMLDAKPREVASVVIVEDDAVTRKALSLAIESAPELRLLAAVDSVQAALAYLETHQVDVLITDFGLPDGSALDIIRACGRRQPNCSVMVLTVSSDEANVLGCIEAGAAGYVLKDAVRTDVVRAVLDLRRGGAPMSPAIARMVMARVRDRKKAQQPSDNTPPATSLTPREAAILDLIACGDSYGEVARRLSVSVGTVQTHIKNIYGKLAVHSRGEAVFEAHRRGLLQMGKPKSRK